MAIQTNKGYYPNSTSPQITTYFVLTITETVDIANNKSVLNCTLTTNQNPTGSGYHRTLNSGTVKINGTSYTVSSNSVSHGTVVWSKNNIEVEHNDDGSKAITASISINLGGDILSGSGIVQLTSIPRNSTMAVSDNLLEENGSDLTITITSYIETHTHVLKVFNGETEMNSVTLSAGETEVTYSNSTLSGYVGDISGMGSLSFRLYTYENGEQVGVVFTQTVLFRKGVVALSLWQNGNSVGVKSGEEATGEGVFLPAQNMIQVVSVTIQVSAMNSKSYKTVSTDVAIPEGYTALGVISPVVNNAVIALVGAYGAYNSSGVYRVSMKLVLNYANQGACSCSCKVLCIYTG